MIMKSKTERKETSKKIEVTTRKTEIGKENLPFYSESCLKTMPIGLSFYMKPAKKNPNLGSTPLMNDFGGALNDSIDWRCLLVNSNTHNSAQ